jgi:transcriptional regulator NrdR family protein
MTTDCPECETGHLATYASRRRGTGTLERRRRCSCCQYRDVITLRPAQIISLRVVQKQKTDSTRDANPREK